MKWAGHVERMDEDRLQRRQARREKGRRGRPCMRWLHCIRRQWGKTRGDQPDIEENEGKFSILFNHHP